MNISFSFPKEERGAYVFPQESGLKKENCILPGKWSSLLPPRQGQGVKEAELEEEGAMRHQAFLAAPRECGHCSALSEPFPQPPCPMLPSFLHATDCSPSQLSCPSSVLSQTSTVSPWSLKVVT